jgi:hypothetical protein
MGLFLSEAVDLYVVDDFQFVDDLAYWLRKLADHDEEGIFRSYPAMAMDGLLISAIAVFNTRSRIRYEEL